MEYTNYIKINKDNLNYNLNYINKTYNYKYIILDISNNAFQHGMYLINYLSDNIYIYTNNFNDIQLARKYNKNIPLIYGGEITLNNIYDLILNNVILLIRNIDILNIIKIKDQINIILKIDIKGYDGINKEEEIKAIKSIPNDINLIGIMAKIKEEDYLEFCSLIEDYTNLELMILNDEDDKNKIKLANAIKLDKSVYGINKKVKTGLFKKDKNLEFKQVFSLNTKIVKITTLKIKKKEKIIGIIPFGILNGLNELITHVAINQKLYNIINIFNEYSLIEIDETVSLNDIVNITNDFNPLENYFPDNTLNYFNLFSNNLPIIYDDYTLEKTYIY